MVQIPERTLTLAEFLRLPETKPASEYVDGKIIQKPMPQGKHSKLQSSFVNRINGVLEEPEIALALPELRCTFGGRSIVPDVAVFTWQRLPVEANGDIANGFDAAPDWVIEILSPDQSQTKVVRNIFHCLEHGCQLGWLVDPEERSIFIYPPGEATQLIDATHQALLRVPEFAAGLDLTIDTVLRWLHVRKSD